MDPPEAWPGLARPGQASGRKWLGFSLSLSLSPFSGKNHVRYDELSSVLPLAGLDYSFKKLNLSFSHLLMDVFGAHLGPYLFGRSTLFFPLSFFVFSRRPRLSSVCHEK